MQPASNSRTTTAIYKEIGQTAERIADLCELIDEARCDYAISSWDNEDEELQEAERQFNNGILRLRKAMKRRNKLGRELNEKIHKAD